MPDHDPDLRRKTRAIAAIPEAWRELVDRCDDSLIELLAVEVEAKTGLRPDSANICEFLEWLSNPLHLETERTSETHPGIRGPSIYPAPRKEAES